MNLSQVVADARQGVAVISAVLGTAVAEHLVHGAWPSTVIGVLGAVGAGLAVVKVPPSTRSAMKALSIESYPPTRKD